MKARCSNPNRKDYEKYEKRGFSAEWKEFDAFLEDMGERPHKTSLDRINNEKGYSKDNCRWATHKQQCRNKTTNNYISYNGETRALMEWCDILGLKYHTIRERIFVRNWSVKKAFEKPIGKWSKK